MEKKENREDCLKCEDPEKPEHCHCVEAKISDTMRENCRKAWKKCQLAGGENSDKQKHVIEINEEKKAKYQKEEESRITKVKEALAKKSCFLSQTMMVPVYSKEKKKTGEKSKQEEETVSQKDKIKKEKDSSKKSSSGFFQQNLSSSGTQQDQSSSSGEN